MKKGLVLTSLLALGTPVIAMNCVISNTPGYRFCLINLNTTTMTEFKVMVENDNPKDYKVVPLPLKSWTKISYTGPNKNIRSGKIIIKTKEGENVVPVSFDGQNHLEGVKKMEDIVGGAMKSLGSLKE